MPPKTRIQLMQENKALSERNFQLVKEIDKMARDGRNALPEADQAILRRAREKTHIVRKGGLNTCFRCGEWLHGITSPSFCPHCGRPFQDQPERKRP